MTPQEIRERVHEVIGQAESNRGLESAVALERLDRALGLVLDELDRTVPGAHETVMFSQYRVCRDLAQALGMEVPA